MVIRKNTPVTSAIFLCELNWDSFLSEGQRLGEYQPAWWLRPRLVQTHAAAIPAVPSSFIMPDACHGALALVFERKS